MRPTRHRKQCAVTLRRGPPSGTRTRAARPDYGSPRVAVAVRVAVRVVRLDLRRRLLGHTCRLGTSVRSSRSSGAGLVVDIFAKNPFARHERLVVAHREIWESGEEFREPRCIVRAGHLLKSLAG